MIQDILPRHLDNQFRWLTPQKSDIILLFEGSSVLAKWQDEKIYYPDYEEFCTQTDAAAFRESFPMRKCMRNIKVN